MQTDRHIAEKLRDLASHLYDDIYLDLPPNGFVHAMNGFYLDKEGYSRSFLEILRILFSIPIVRELWSERSMSNRVDDLLGDLGKIKAESNSRNKGPVDFQRITSDWLSSIPSEFDTNEYFASVNGLIIQSLITIGSVTFWPLKEKLSELGSLGGFNPFSELSEFQSCLASSSIQAEYIRGSEILRERVEEVLNILRYMGALVWHGQPIKHIYLEGEAPKRFSNILSLHADMKFEVIGNALFWPINYEIDKDFLSIAENYRLWELSSWFKEETLSPIRKLLLSAIQWFGDATQEIKPIQAFIKYYIAIETILKMDKERAKNVLPRRVSYVLEARDKTRKETEVLSIINERNSVFHTGSTYKDPPEVLARVTHQWSRNIINSLVQNSFLSQFYPEGHPSKWQTKDDLIRWIDMDSVSTNG